MKFIVTQADHYKPFEDYGLKTMAITFNDTILTNINDINESEEISYKFSEIEIKSLEELLKFIKKCKCKGIVGKYKTWFKSDSIYEYELKLYNYYIE